MATVTSTQILWNAFLGNLFLLIGPWLPKLKTDVKTLHGKTAIVTGSNSGIGYGIALQLAEMGATAYLAGRNEKKALAAKDSILKSVPNGDIRVVALDTASFSSVQSFAKQWTGTIDILVHNAGVGTIPQEKEFTDDGFEHTYQANFLSSFLLTHLLESHSHLSPTARIIFTSSVGSYFGTLYSTIPLTKTTHTIDPGFHAAPSPTSKQNRYSQSKIMQAAFAKILQQRFDMDPDTERLAFSFEPGLVQTNLLSGTLQPFGKDPVSWVLKNLLPLTGLDVRQGAATGVHLAVSEGKEVLEGKGRYFDRMRVRAHPVDLYSQEHLTKLWIRWCADAGVEWV